jgi:hypothetical protein
MAALEGGKLPMCFLMDSLMKGDEKWQARS